MRKFLIITLVLLAVLVMATAASASVRDSVASLVGARTGAAADSGGTGTYTVKSLGDGEASEDAWAVNTEAATANAGETQAISYGPSVEPSGDGDCDADRTGDEIAPVGPDAQVQPEEPVATETATKKAKKGQTAEEPVIE